MRHESIALRGTYKYASPATLEHALDVARAHLEVEDLTDWMQAVTRQGNTLRIDATVPAAADRFLAAAIIAALAACAIDGVVEASRGGRSLELIPAGLD